MTNLREIYRCEICGHLIEILNEGAPTLTCCNQLMTKLKPKTQDEGNEKHVPVIEEIPGGIKVKVGSISHPMIPEHFIKFIEVLTKDGVYRIELNAGQIPEVQFLGIKETDVIEAREFCNIHGFWKSK